MSRKQFVSLMQELHSAQPAKRAAILQKYGTSEAGVRAYVKALSADPMALSQVFDTLQVRIDRDQFAGPKKFPPRPPR